LQPRGPVKTLWKLVGSLSFSGVYTKSTPSTLMDVFLKDWHLIN